jgi:hypothetical protein
VEPGHKWNSCSLHDVIKLLDSVIDTLPGDTDTQASVQSVTCTTRVVRAGPPRSNYSTAVQHACLREVDDASEPRVGVPPDACNIRFVPACNLLARYGMTRHDERTLHMLCIYCATVSERCSQRLRLFASHLPNNYSYCILISPRRKTRF